MPQGSQRMGMEGWSRNSSWEFINTPPLTAWLLVMATLLASQTGQHMDPDSRGSPCQGLAWISRGIFKPLWWGELPGILWCGRKGAMLSRDYRNSNSLSDPFGASLMEPGGIIQVKIKKCVLY